MNLGDANKIKEFMDAVYEARRFIKRAEAAVEAIDAENGSWGAGKQIAAAKRSSMDLTRSLVAIRK